MLNTLQQAEATDMLKSLIHGTRILAILTWLGGANAALAGSQTWNNGSGDFTWNAGSLNWSGSTWTTGSDAVFGATGVGTITVSGTQTVGTGSDTPLTFNTAGYTLAGGTLLLPGAGNTSTLAVNANANISALLASGGTVVESGNGTLTLNPGAGNANSVGSLTTTAGGLTLTSGTLNVTASGGVQGPGLYVHGGTLTVAGGTLNATAGIYATINNNGTLSVTSGTCNINNGAELLNGYGSTGTINVSGTGVLNVNILRISQGTGIINLNGGTLQLNRFNSAGGTGTVNFNGATVQAKSSTTSFTPLGYTYNVQAGGASVDTAGNSITIAAPLTHDGTLGAIPDGGLTKQGAGSLTLSGTNTYTGPTTVNGGTLSLNQPMLSAVSAVTLATNTILNLNFTGSNTVMALALDGVQMPAGTYNAASTPTYFTGTGSLVNLGGNATLNLAWTRATNNNWDTATTNWSSLGAATTWVNAPTPANASFGTTGAGTVNLTQAISANNLTFNAAGYTLAGNTLTLGTNAPNLIVNANATITSVLTNSTGIAMTGKGTLTLSGANAFSGNVAVNSGNLVINNQRALGFAAATVANGSQISVGLATTYTNALTLTGSPANGALQFNGGTAGWSGPITLAGGARIGGYAGSGSYTLSGGIGGTGDLEIWAGGASATHVHNFTVSAPCSYTGNTLLNTYAACPVVILSGGANRLPTNTVLNLLAGIWNGQVLSATLKLNGNSQALAGLASGSGVFGSGGSNSVVNGSATAATLSVNGALNNFFDGYLGGPGANQNNFSLIKNGAAELTINRACTLSGTIAVNGGMLNLPGGINGGNVTVANGATLLLGSGPNQVAGLALSASSTLGVNLGATNNPNNTTLQISGNLVLAGTILIQDLGDAAVSNAPTVISYTGTLSNLGMSTDPRSQWMVRIDTATPGKVKFMPISKLGTISFTTANQTVSNSLQLDLTGVVHGFPSAPVYYEVRTPDNRLWDFGAMPPTANWTIHLRHLRSGTNNVRVFTLGTGGALQQDTRQVVLQLAANPPVRPRPYPAEIWWGGVATALDPDYGFSQLVDPARPWNFVKQYQDGIFLHGILPTSGTLAQLAAAVAPALGRFGQEDGYYTKADTSFGVNRAASYNNTLAQLAGEGINISFRSTDYQPGVSVWPGVIDPGWCQNWPNWTHAQLLNSNMQCWTDFVTILHTNWPGLKVGMTWSPVYFNWNGYPCTLGADALTLHPVKDASGNVILNQYGTNAWFDFDMQEFFAKASTTAQAGDGYFGFASDCPYDYFAQWSNANAQATNQAKIFAYEAWERTNGYFPTTICNYSHANSPDTNVWDQQFTQNSFTYLMLKQQLGGRTQKYLFESWYSGPYTWAPESNPNSFSGMVKLAIKYLKGIADTNGSLEGLALTRLSSGATNTIELRNDGDITCLPAVAGYETGSGSGTVTYYNAAGSNITALVLSAEGYVHTNCLAPGQTTTIRVVTSLPLNRAVTLEAFWNPQDPTGVVRDRLTLTPTNQPPMLNTISNRTVIAGQTLTLNNAATDPDSPPQTLTFSLLAAPVGMTLNPTNGLLSWRPAIAQSPTTNSVTVQVADNGTPSLSATQRFTVTVLSPAAPGLTAPAVSGGVFSLLVNGSSGPDYILQAATNLNPPVFWLPLQTNLAATPPFTFTDPANTNFTSRFYRVVLGP
ncbi:MAG: autotransporter-associated beta strand repeat-containing protein [Verrucomicrobiota bacterium]